MKYIFIHFLYILAEFRKVIRRPHHFQWKKNKKQWWWLQGDWCCDAKQSYWSWCFTQYDKV